MIPPIAAEQSSSLGVDGAKDLRQSERGTLDDTGREKWRGCVGERIDLDDEEGWFRSAASMARDVFDRLRRRQRRPPGKSEPSPQLLAKAVSAAGPDVAPEAIETRLRGRIVGRPPWMQDMLLRSVMT